MIVGIDLGTTNSAIGIWRNGRAELIPNSLGSVLTPSAVSVDDSGEFLIGLAARERQVTHPASTATAFKRFMGSNRSIMLGTKHSLRPEELSAMVLRSLKSDAEVFLGEPVSEAVITVPAYFNDKQRKATRRAGQLAGFEVERLVNEPTAAALAYGIHELANESRFLVFDLGGGTFDVSILEIFEGVIEVRSSTGDNQLGGEDFNQVLIDDFKSSLHGSIGGGRKITDQGFLERVREQAERARRQLSTQPSAVMSVAWQERIVQHEVTAERFETLCGGLLERLREPVVRAMRDGKIGAETLKEIILVGGATRMPVVRRTVTRMFGRFPSAGPNPDEAVAIGAAIQAGLKSRDAALKDVVMTDVCPYTLGVDTAERRADGTLSGGVFAPIIERNTVVPASRIKRFFTAHDNQRHVVFKIFQGESRKVDDNVRLGEIDLLVPPKRAGEVFIDVRFTYDINGLLEVDVKNPETGETRQIVIADEDVDMNSSEMQRRRDQLAALKIHPREADDNRAALARGTRCYEQFLGDRREYVGRLVGQFEAILDRQNPAEIERARAEFMKALDAIDGDRYL
jgi:molecular chaperone HscC